MGNFMIDIDLLDVHTEEFQQSIPLQVECISMQMQSGHIISYSLNMDRTKLWIVVNAKTRTETLKVLKEMPLFKFFDFKIHELMFNNLNLPLYTTFSLN